MESEYDKIIAATNQAIKKGWDNAKIEWQRMALNTIYQLCLRNPEITVNDFSLIIKNSPLKTHDNRAIGGAVVSARRFGWIERTDRVVVRETSISKTSHRGPTSVVWKSLIYRERQEAPASQPASNQQFMTF